ncbi:MAG: pilus assembly PilX family protein [bacterium]
MKQQQGAVLAIGLLILLVLTIIGVSAMRVSVLDERIAANAQFKMMTFQAAESALTSASSFENVSNFAETGQQPGRFTYKADASAEGGDISIAVDTLIEDKGEIPLPASSMALGRTGGAVLHLYEITATASIDDDKGVSIHRLAVGRVVPSANGR